MTPVYLSCLSGGHVESVNSLSLSANDILASGGEDGYVCLWSSNEQPQPVAIREIDQESCSAVLFSEEKPELLYTACGRRIVVWDTRQMAAPVTSWMENENEINSLDLLESGHVLASADDSGEVKIIDTSNGHLYRTLHKHDNICSVVKFRPNRAWQLISGGLDCRLIVSDWKGSGLGVMIFEMEELIETDYNDDSNGAPVHLPMVHCLATTKSGSHIVCGLENATVEVFNGSGKNMIHVESLYGHTKGVSSLLCVDESHLVSGGNDGSLFAWQLIPDGTGRHVTHGQQINSIAGSRLDRIYVADYTSSIQLVDLVVS